MSDAVRLNTTSVKLMLKLVLSLALTGSSQVNYLDTFELLPNTGVLARRSNLILALIIAHT